MDIKYVIKEPNEDPTLAVIEKQGDSYTFTMQGVMDAKAYNDKREKEIRGQLEVELAKMENVKHNHPEIVEMEPVKRVAAKIYQDSLDYKTQAEAKLVEFEEAKGKLVLELMDIYKQLPELAPKENEEPKEQV